MALLSVFLLSASFLAQAYSTYCITNATNVVCIENAADLVNFAEQVNDQNKTFWGTTVVLVNDINMANMVFEPIGEFEKSSFDGTFDGNGHTISNLNITSDKRAVGLIGFSRSSTVQNLVLDASNIFHSTYTTEEVENIWCYAGAFFGDCKANYGNCVVKGSVNMGSVLFTGSTNDAIFTGGIHGACDADNNDCITRNVVNYGSITCKGYAKGNANIGGITGLCHGQSNNQRIRSCNYLNCMNYGSLTQEDTKSNDLYFGGIVGRCCDINTVENCLSAGKLTWAHDKENYKIGGVVGRLDSSSVNHSFWTDDTNAKVGYSGASPEQGKSTLNASLIEELNSHNSDDESTGKWLLNRNGYTVTFIIDGKVYMSCASVVVAVPAIVGKNFSGWYTDKLLEVPINTTQEITADTTFYSKLNYDEKTSSSSSSLPSSFSSLSSSSSSSSSSSPSSSSSVNITDTVEITIEKKALSKSEVEEIIKGLIPCSDCYERIESVETDEGIKVIIKFTDVTSAKNFVESVEETSKLSIKIIRFINEGLFSFAPVLNTFLSLVLV